MFITLFLLVVKLHQEDCIDIVDFFLDFAITINPWIVLPLVSSFPFLVSSKASNVLATRVNRYPWFRYTYIVITIKFVLESTTRKKLSYFTPFGIKNIFKVIPFGIQERTCFLYYNYADSMQNNDFFVVETIDSVSIATFPTAMICDDKLSLMVYYFF